MGINLKAKWQDLNHLQVGKYAEYYFKIKFVSYGLDVYTLWRRSFTDNDFQYNR